MLLGAGAQQPADARIEQVRGERLQQHSVASRLEQRRNAVDLRRHHEHGGRHVQALRRADDTVRIGQPVRVGDQERCRPLHEILSGDVAVRRRHHARCLPKHSAVFGGKWLRFDQENFVVNRGGRR